MSFNVAASSIATGVGLTVYGGYKYLTANQKTADDVIQQKNLSLGFIAAGVAAIAVGAGLIYSGATQIGGNPMIPLSTPPGNEVASTIEEVVSCPINALKDILNKWGSNSIITKIFNVFKDTQGISCSNYRSWEDKFHTGGIIDSIHPKDLKEPAMWGIDEWERPYLAIKYVCDRIEGAAALFQRYTDSGNLIASGGHFQAEGCVLGPLDPQLYHKNRTVLLGNLTSFLRGEEVVSSKWGNKAILKLAK